MFETSFRSPPVTPDNSDQVVDSDRHLAFIDEHILGYRRQLPGQMSVDVSYVHRDYRDRPAGVEINRIIENNVFRGYRNEAQNDIFFITNNIWNTQVYDGLELTVANSPVERGLRRHQRHQPRRGPAVPDRRQSAVQHDELRDRA